MKIRWLVPVLLATAVFVVAADGPVAQPAAENSTPAKGEESPKAVELKGSLEVRALGLQVHYPEKWSVQPKRYRNMHELLYVPAGEPGVAGARSARVKIFSENRLDHAEALLRLQQIASGIGAPASAFQLIGGWPGIQHTYADLLDQPSQGPQFADPKILRVTTVVASGSRLVRLEGVLPTDAAQGLVEQVKAIGLGLVFEKRADPDRAREELDGLRASPVEDPAPAAGSSDVSGAVQPLDSPPGAAPLTRRIISNNFGELEIAVSPDGQNIVVGNQSLWAASNDGGQTFPLTGSIPFSGGDPSLAFGQSGSFYYAGIRGGCQPADVAGPFGYTCTGIARSNNNGQTFPIVGNASVCPNNDPNSPPNPDLPNDCFPDQEHIAADRVNPGPGGLDQVYNTWRNFVTNPNDQDPGLTCSQDSGATWTAPLILAGNGRFPRIGVGPNGFVYVVFYDAGMYMVDKYSSCATGLVQQAGFPVPIVARTPIVCPFVGHDRCDQNPSSQTIAVDDTNPNHLYFAYAEDAGGGTDHIFVKDSLDGGLTWPAARRVRVNTNVPGKRIMPWACTTGGKAFVTWYDRRSATPCPVPPCPSPNDVTDYYGGSAALDLGGNLTAGGDFLISPVPDNWCDSGWPCRTREVASSDQCSTQPQLAGRCCDNTVANCPGSQQPCDFSDTLANPALCPAGETCNTGNGCPKYGDYNGNACAAGRLFAAWASRVAPAPLPPDPNNAIDILFAGLIVGNVPQIQVPGNIQLPDACVGSTTSATLNVCNTGKADLHITSITDSSTQFNVTTPSSGYPVTISPDFCFPFQVTFSPTSPGSKSATLTINSDDPTNPSVTVQATGVAGVPDVRVTGSSDFGDVCGGALAEKRISVCNVGACNLTVTGVDFNPACPDFTLINRWFPAVVSPDFCMELVIRFTPTSAGPKSCTLIIHTDDPDTPDRPVVVTANTPVASIDVPDDLAFPPTVINSVGACQTPLPFPVSNTGGCNLSITDLAISDNPAEYSISGRPSYPIVLEPGHIAGEGDLQVVFAPDLLDRDELGQVSVTYVSDPITGATTTETRALCGEGVRTGARVLVRAGGVPLPLVESLKIQRINANRNRNLLDTVESARDLPLVAVIPAPPCGPFQYHREYGTVSNPIQLLPGSYQITAVARVAGKIVRKTVGFDLSTCDFNPTIIIDF